LSATRKFFYLQFAVVNLFSLLSSMQTAGTIRTSHVAYSRRSTRSTSLVRNKEVDDAAKRNAKVAVKKMEETKK